MDKDFTCLIVCVAGWIPTHAVIRVTDNFRHISTLLLGLCGWRENGCIVTTAEQAGATAIRPAFEALGYSFKYIYKPQPLKKIDAFLSACYAKKALHSARIETMDYRDMLLYGLQFEGQSMRSQIGIEVEPFEMLEMVQNIDKLDAAKGDVCVLPAAFGLLNTSLLNVSKVKTGYATYVRLIYMYGKYRMHVYTGEAKELMYWNEYGWDDPAPQFPSLQVFLDSCTMEEFAQNVSCQHVIVALGDYSEAIKSFCKLMDIELVM